MILEVITNDFTNKCGNCKYFKTENHIDGYCINEDSKVLNKNRFYNSKSCVQKEIK